MGGKSTRVKYTYIYMLLHRVKNSRESLVSEIFRALIVYTLVNKRFLLIYRFTLIF